MATFEWIAESIADLRCAVRLVERATLARCGREAAYPIKLQAEFLERGLAGIVWC